MLIRPARKKGVKKKILLENGVFINTYRNRGMKPWFLYVKLQLLAKAIKPY
jgi:hypothetical protein